MSLEGVSNEDLLCKIDQWILGRSKTNGVMKTYDEINRHDIYDNSLAVCYLTMRGKLSEAKAILDAFAQSLYGVSPQDILGERVEADLPSGAKAVHLLVASYGDLDRGTDMGNNLYAGIAFARYAAASEDASYALIAHDMLVAIWHSRGCSDEFGGVMRRLPASRLFSNASHDKRSGEHNIDLVSLARMLGESEILRNAQQFVGKLFTRYTDAQGAAAAKYGVGTGWSMGLCGRVTVSDWPEGHFITDTTFWNILADADEANPANLAEAMRTAWNCVHATDTYEGETYHGVKFTSKGEGIQWENTCTATAAMEHFLHKYPGALASAGFEDTLKERLSLYRDSIKRMICKYGCMYASVHPSGQTGLGWKYLVTPHLGATAWAGMMLMQETLGDDANPYAVPPQKVPNKEEAKLASREAIPQESPSSASSSPSSCSRLFNFLRRCCCRRQQPEVSQDGQSMQRPLNA